MDEINTDIQPGAARTYMNSMQVVFSQKLSSVYDAYQELYRLCEFEINRVIIVSIKL